MPDLCCLNNKLAIIGFDALTPDLTCVDQVAAALYKGDLIARVQTELSLFSDYSRLCNASITRVLKSNQLTAKQLAVIIISNSEQIITDAELTYFSCTTVANLGDALHLSEQLINNEQLAVLLMAAKINPLASALQTPQQSMATISFADDFCGYGSSLGVCAILLASPDFAATLPAYQYALIESAVSTDDLCLPIDYLIKQALIKAAINSEQISSIEVSARSEQSLSELESTGLLHGYQNGKTLHTSLSCNKSVFGENGALSQLLGLLNCVLALQQRYRPAIKQWSAPISSQLSQWLSSPFYLFNHAATVFPNTQKSPRYMAYSCLSETQYSHLVLQENNDQLMHSNGFNACSYLSLFIIGDDTQAGLTEQIVALINNSDEVTLKGLAQSLYEKEVNSIYKLVIVAETIAQLKQELTMALSGVHLAFANKSVWKTPKGSYFTSQPMHSEQQIGFLYPGIGASYLGLGRDLLQLFPQIYPTIVAMADDIGDTLQDTLIHPRSICALDFKQRQQCDLVLRGELAKIAQCGVGYACIFSKIFTQVFNIHPHVATGYSMGEVSMFSALDCWQEAQLLSQRLTHSAIFKQRLAGELSAIREHWQLTNAPDKPIWESYSVKATAKQIKEVLLPTDRVYITIINSPDSLIIAGYPDDCLAVCQRLALRAIPMQVANAIHCPPAHGEYENMQALYTLEVAEKVQCKLYSSSCYLPIPQHTKAIAISISKCLCEPVDFPRLINTLYQQGCRVFMEMGAGSSLTNWTDKILQQSKASDYLAVAVNAKGVSDQLSIARAVAKLLSLGININVHSFFHGSVIQPCKSLNKQY